MLKVPPGLIFFFFKNIPFEFKGIRTNDPFHPAMFSGYFLPVLVLWLCSYFCCCFGVFFTYCRLNYLLSSNSNNKHNNNTSSFDCVCGFLVISVHEILFRNHSMDHTHWCYKFTDWNCINSTKLSATICKRMCSFQLNNYQNIKSSPTVRFL